MARKERKTMLAGLMGVAADTEPATTRAPSSPPSARRGAVGAISSAVADMRANAVLDLDPTTILTGGLADRIGTDDEDDAELRRSIKRHGQQVPVLVRPHPDKPKAWQIVYGRRRVQAALDLGMKVKALVRDLDDEALLVAQGQENSARRDLSFVEKASFARQLADAGYDRAVICDALAVDKTLLSRMLSIIEQLPQEVVQFIGAAHGIGRPRWLELVDLLDRRNATLQDIEAFVADEEGQTSAARFETILRHLKQDGTEPKARAKKPDPKRFHASDGTRFASAKRSSSSGKLSIAIERVDGFDEWLLERLQDLHSEWMASKE